MTHFDESARRAIDAKTKPLGALGRLEDIAVRLAVLQGTLAPRVDVARACVFAGDHGVTAEGVSAYPSAVTAEMMKNFVRGGAAINVIARTHSIDVEVIDVGVDADLTALEGIRHANVRRGTRNFAVEAAMTDAELDAALAVGADAAQRAATSGVQVLCLGEMGIGNTTSASALLSALTGQPASVTVGRGTGVDNSGLERKRVVVDRAIARHGLLHPGTNARDHLRCVGGLEIAAIAGGAIEAARRRIAVVADGFISTVAIACAARLAVAEHDETALRLREALFFSHRSAEWAHALALGVCGATIGADARPLLELDMRLGEGTGAAMAVPLLRTAAAILCDMATFASANVSAGNHAADHREGTES